MLRPANLHTQSCDAIHALHSENNLNRRKITGCNTSHYLCCCCCCSVFIPLWLGNRCGQNDTQNMLELLQLHHIPTHTHNRSHSHKPGHDVYIMKRCFSSLARKQNCSAMKLNASGVIVYQCHTPKKNYIMNDPITFSFRPRPRARTRTIHRLQVLDVISLVCDCCP